MLNYLLNLINIALEHELNMFTLLHNSIGCSFSFKQEFNMLTFDMNNYIACASLSGPSFFFLGFLF